MKSGDARTQGEESAGWISFAAFVPAALALLVGAVGFAAMFAMAIRSDKLLLVFGAAYLCFLLGGVWLGCAWPRSVWHLGALINLPTWLIFFFVADPGQFREKLMGLVAGLVFAYLGAAVGWRIAHRKRRTCNHGSDESFDPP
jgi:hypothetical protein